MERYDLCVIGGGPSGYAAAMRALDFDKRVILIEKDRLGGAGLYNGALSSKTFWELSKEFAASQQMLERQGAPPREVEFGGVLREVEDAVGERADQLAHHLERIQAQNGAKFDFARGFARLQSPTEVEIQANGASRTVSATNIVLATGSRPRVLPTIPVDEKIILTSDGIGALGELPASIVILGAGVIGCEFATIFANFGKTKVHLIDKEQRILPFEDEDVATIIEQNLEKRGVVIHRGATLKKMEIVAGQVEYALTYNDGREEVFTVEKGLMAVGRVPNYEHMGFEELGLEMRPSGHIIDRDTRCNVPNIFAVGDLTADIALVNVGELEGRHAVEKMFGRPRRKLIYENISTIMFLAPETAGVGLNERQAMEREIPFRVASFDFRCIPRATAMRRTQGFFKILVTEDKKKILGMRAVGEHASSAIQAVALLISMERGVEELADLIHPHPSIIEGVQECARLLLGNSIFKPSVFGEFLQVRHFDGRRFL